MQQQKIVVIGAGYAGLMATLRLWKKTKGMPVTITLVNADDTFGERVRFHQLATGQTLRRLPVADFLRGTAVSFCQGRVTQLQPQQHQLLIETATEAQTLAYDKLIYALGSMAQPTELPGLAENGYTLDRTSARQLATKIAHAAAGQRLVVIGGGATGIEAATEFAEQQPQLQVTLLSDKPIGQMLAPKGQAYVRQVLARLKVEVREDARVTAVSPHTIELADQTTLPYDVALWTGGFGVSPLAQRAGLAVNERGQILVDQALRSISHPDVYAAGDAAFPMQPPGAPVRMAVYMALVMGAHVADTVAAHLQGREERPFGVSWVGLGLSLGRRDSIAQFLRADDTPLNLMLTGKAAIAFKEFFTNFGPWSIHLQRTAPWLFYWIGKNKMKRQSQGRNLQPILSD